MQSSSQEKWIPLVQFIYCFLQLKLYILCRKLSCSLILSYKLIELTAAGERTFGVLTKLDLMDKGTNALDVSIFYFFSLSISLSFPVIFTVFKLPIVGMKAMLEI